MSDFKGIQRINHIFKLAMSKKRLVKSFMNVIYYDKVNFKISSLRSMSILK